MFDYLRFISRFMVYAVLLISLTWLVLWLSEGARIYSVQTNSMEPAIHRGDLVIDTKINPYDLKPGNIISYSGLQTPREVVTHRVININYQQKLIITKGDKLTVADPPVGFSQINGRTFKAIPKAGYVFGEIHKPLGLVVIVYLPALLICFSEMWFLAAKLNGREAYQLI